MRGITHDPLESVRGLQQLLISDKKRIGFLFGAGTSLAKKKNCNTKTIPAIGEMTKIIEDKLSANPAYKEAIKQIKEEIEENHYNVESFLSNIESKASIIGNGKLNGLTKDDFSQLILETKKEIIEIVSIHKEILKDNCLGDLIHIDFAEWIGRANRRYPIEIFTTNYDFLFEIGLEKKAIPYYDGFTGSFEPFFNSDSVEKLDFLPNQTKLWKIHGSLGWKLDDKSKRVLRKEPTKEDILIYPSILKYNNSRKQPYIALMDRLSNYIKQPDTILIVCGYSFGDEHINERILTALKSNVLAHVYVFYYDKYWDNKERGYTLTEDSYIVNLAKENSNLSVFGCRNAIIGSQYGLWKLKKEPDKEDTININLYFDEDGPVNENEEKNVENLGTEKYSGEGELILADFASFTKFIKSMICNTKGESNDY
ncbi:MAG: hypothetical protein CVU99_09090 [Firmicutes bacterium HGW-Firmicutes-4]|jgi:hypothetical protein|nr:MAG: hypothetical protein CVV25_13410 [Ignavibacteriae bacterium HGW-Ignavibacteriae-4]PKM60251.1 MAG: hypothetical protein CVU99_09090 [Firmicutes bacterium HGW-Firmicutes-4]